MIKYAVQLLQEILRSTREKGIAMKEPVRDNIYRHIQIEMDKNFPLEVADTVGIYSESTMLHWHDCIEICLIKEGSGMYYIGGKDYPFKKNDVFIIKSKEIHLAYNDKDVVMQVLLFDPSLLYSGSRYSFEMEYAIAFMEAGIRYGCRLEPENEYYNAIMQALLEIEDEFLAKQNGYQLMIKSLLLKISLSLKRYANIREGNTGLEKRIGNFSRLKPVLDHIEDSYQSPLKLDDLAKLANMSASNLSIVFKRTMGISPIDYLIRARIIKASELLTGTEMKIIDIALECGFSSITNFIKSFKKYTGLLPKDYRKNRK